MKMEGPVPEKRFELFKGNEWTLPTDITLVLLADRVLKFKLEKEHKWSKEDAEDFVDNAFHEALINAFAHGNLGIPGGTKNIYKVAFDKQRINPTDKKVHVSITEDDNNLSVTILDEGEGFDVEKVQDPTLPETKFREMGRGKVMMELSSDSVVYKDGGRKVILVKERKNK
jgi:serine/threonine-protein kinase RsbW